MKKSILDTFHTSQFTWTFNTHGYAGVASAAKQIAAGETVRFECYNRRNPNDRTEMTLEAVLFFGLAEIDGRPAVRESKTKDLFASGTHSVISSGHDPVMVKDPVFIAAALMGFLRTQYVDFLLTPVTTS